MHTECTQTVLDYDNDHGVQGISDEIGAVILGGVSSLVTTFRDQTRMGHAHQTRTLLRESIPTQGAHP